MVDKKITELPVGTITGTDLLPFIDDMGGTPTTSQNTVAALQTFLEAGLPATNQTGLDLVTGDFLLRTARQFWCCKDLEPSSTASSWVDRIRGASMTLVGTPATDADSLIVFGTGKYGTGAGDTPTLTATTGELTVVFGVETVADVTGNSTIWSSRSSGSSGIDLWWNIAEDVRAYTTGTGGNLSVSSGVGMGLRYAVAGFAYNDGTVTVMDDTGSVVTGDYSGVGTMSHNAPKLCALGYGVNNTFPHKVGALAVFDYALTSTQFGQVQTALHAIQNPG